MWLSGSSRSSVGWLRSALPLSRATFVDATIIAAFSSTKNAEGERDSEMHKTHRGNG